MEARRHATATGFASEHRVTPLCVLDSSTEPGISLAAGCHRRILNVAHLDVLSGPCWSPRRVRVIQGVTALRFKKNC